MFQPLNATNDHVGGADLPAGSIADNVVSKKQDAYDEEQIMVSYSQALQLLGDKDYSSAESELEQLRNMFISKMSARREHKLMFPVLLNLADCYSQLGRSEEALNTLKEACALNKKNTTAWYKLGCLAVKTQSVYDAALAFKEAVSNCSGTHWVSLTKLCQCLFVMGLYDDCIFYCLKGLSENSYFAAGHTLLLEIIKQEKSILRYNRALKENLQLLDGQFFDTKIISECESIRRQHDSFVSKVPSEVKALCLCPTVKLQVNANQKISLSEICRYLALVCEEALLSSSSIDCNLKVQKELPSTSEDGPTNSVANSQRLPTTPQQTTRLSRLSTLAMVKSGSGQTTSGGSLKSKLLKYLSQLKGLIDPSSVPLPESASVAARRLSASLTNSLEEAASKGKLIDCDITEDLRILTEEKLSLRDLVKYFLDRLVELANTYCWEKDDAASFCHLFLLFRKFTPLKPYSSLEDEWNVSICSIVRVFLEALIEFLTQCDGQYVANFVSPSITLDLTDEIDCVTLPSLLCHTARNLRGSRKKEEMIRHCLLFFRLSKVTHNFELMQLASSSCRSTLHDFPEFSSVFLGHVFRHPVWRRDEILMEMKWTQCYEQLRSKGDLFETKNWEAICSQFSESDIFDSSNLELIVLSDLANFAPLFVEALFRCSNESATDVLLTLLTCLLDKLLNGRQAPLLKQLLADSWQLCYDNFEKVSAAKTRGAITRTIITTAEHVFSFLESNACMPFNCASLICCVYSGFSLLNDAGISYTFPLQFNLSFSDALFSGTDQKRSFDDADSSDDDEDSDFAKLPPAVKFLILFHDVLASCGGSCRSDNGTYLELIRDRLVEFIQSPAAIAEGMTKASRLMVEKQIDQCVFCLLGMSLRRLRGKATQITEHPTNKTLQQQLTWSVGIKLYSYYRPRELPAYDSFKGDSISTEFANFLKKLLALSPATSVFAAEELDDYLRGSFESVDDFTKRVCDLKAAASSESESESEIDQGHYASICYLLADHAVKNAEYTVAMEQYKTAVRFQPTLFDAWAGLALCWQSSINAALDECDSLARPCDPEILQPIVRCFQLALTIEPSNGKLQMEFASFVFDIYSLIRRIERNKGRGRSSNINSPFTAEQIAEKFVGHIPATVSDLLQLAFDAFSRSNASCDIDPPSDRWFCLYMLGKIGEKLGQGIVAIIDCFVQALELLFEHDAVFPGSRTVTSQNAPRHAIECFELFYRIHADILKFLASEEINVFRNPESQSNEDIVNKIDALTVLAIRLYSKRLAATPVFADFCKIFDKVPEESEVVNATSEQPVLSKLTELARICIHALAFCSTRFPEHFKSRYRLARAFFDHPFVTNTILCGSVLLGWPIPEEENKGPFAGVKFGSSLFDPRKLQSGSTGAMMTGFWRSAHPDIDRRGTFFAHTEKCVRLLLQFLRSCQSNSEAWKLLNAAHVQLARPATSARRYLRDVDQSSLALKSLELAVETLTSSLSIDAPCTREKLLDVYRLQQLVVRGGFVSLIEKTTCLLIACYCSSQIGNEAKSGEDQFSPPTVSEVERFCQNLILQEKQQQKASRRLSVSAGNTEIDREVEAVLRSVVDRVATGIISLP